MASFYHLYDLWCRLNIDSAKNTKGSEDRKLGAPTDDYSERKFPQSSFDAPNDNQDSSQRFHRPSVYGEEIFTPSVSLSNINPLTSPGLKNEPLRAYLGAIEESQ